VLLFAKFVPGLDGITPPLAGIAGASRLRFLLYDAGGSGAWAGAYLGAGFLFASQLEKIAHYTSVAANALILVLGVPLVIFFVWKLLQMMHIIRWLRPLHITPEQLQARLNAGEEFALVDLQRFEDDPEDCGVIPGSIRADPAKLRTKVRFVMPDRLEMVLYCEGKNDFVSARVAAVLRQRGIGRILILSGEVMAWKALGYPLAPPVADPLSRARQLGMQFIPSPWGEGEAYPVQPELSDVVPE
jgi:rhodanese-related sulfurtransferase